MKNIARHPVFSGANTFHTLTEQDVAEWSKQNDEQNKDVSFQVQARRIFHTVFASPLALPFNRASTAVAAMRVSVSMDCVAHPGVTQPTTESTFHKSFENDLTRCFTGTKDRAAKYFVFCYPFSIASAVAGLTYYRRSGVAQS